MAVGFCCCVLIQVGDELQIRKVKQMEFRLKTLTPIWTGGVRKDNSALHLTSIRGAIRWWYEVLIRGLGYYVCDPTANGCKVNISNEDKKKIEEGKISLTDYIKGEICPACYFFGCTGWSGKFVIRLTKPKTNKSVSSLQAGAFLFNIHFIEKKKFEKEEISLLKMTLKLIVDYGAIGGRTTFKPSEKNYKNMKLHHKDFGLIIRAEDSNIPNLKEKIYEIGINEYLKGLKKRDSNDEEWPDLKNFWFIKDRCLNRKQINKIVERDKHGNYHQPSEFSVFLGGFISREKRRFSPELCETYKSINSISKKIFSFHGTGQKDGKKVKELFPRCFGYTKKETELDNVVELIKGQFKKQFPEESSFKIKKGKEVLNGL